MLGAGGGIEPPPKAYETFMTTVTLARNDDELGIYMSHKDISGT